MSSISGVVLIAVTMLVSGCSMSSQNLPRAGNEAAPLINRSVLLKDAHGAVLGNVAETDAASVTVFTSKGYFVSLGWNGVPVDGTCWFTEAKGMGKPFFIALSTDKLFGFSVSVNGRVYVAATVDASGFAVSDPSITGFQSYYSGSGNTTDAAGGVPAGHVAYPLKPVGFADLGLPSSIARIEQLVFR